MGDDFAAELDSIENVIGLSPRDPLNGFAGKMNYKKCSQQEKIILKSPLSFSKFRTL